MERPLVLVLDGDAGASERLSRALAPAECDVLAATTEGDALRTIERAPVKVVLASSPPWERAAGGFVERAARLRPALAIVALLDLPSFSEEAEALRAGAFDVASRQQDPARLRLAVERALAQHDLLEERLALRAKAGGGSGPIAGAGVAMDRLRRKISSLAPIARGVVFSGEPGTGKRLAARALHEASPRRERPLVVVECGALGAGALEQELLGSGLERPGAIERAREGTLVLADVDALPLPVQDALAEAIPETARVVATTTADLARRVEEGRLRADLLKRIGEAVVAVPPLRERPEDVAALAGRFVEEIRAINDLPPTDIAPEALDALGAYPWPGNVRELRHAVEQGMVLSGGGTIRLADLPEPIRGTAARTPADGRFREAKRRVVEEFEKRYLGELLERHGGNVTAAAQRAGMLRSALQRLLRKYDLRSSSFRGRGGERSLD